MARAGELPELLTVEEAAAVLRVGRTMAYAMAREWRATNGRSGLPVLDFGSVLRVPLHRLEAMVGGELHAPAHAPVPGDAPVATAPADELERSPRQMVTEPARRPTATSRPASRGRHKVDPRQLSLMPARPRYASTDPSRRPAATTAVGTTRFDRAMPSRRRRSPSKSCERSSIE